MATMLDPEDRIVGPEKGDGHEFRPGVTWGFNAGLFAFLGVLGFLGFVIRSWGSGPVSIPGAIFSTVFDLGRYVWVVALAAYFVQEFWARFAGARFGLRAIVYREAVAIVLMFGLLAGR